MRTAHPTRAVRDEAVYSTHLSQISYPQQETNITAVNMSEDAAIRATIQHYLDGARLGKGDLMKPAFAEGATIFGYVGPDLFAGPIQGLFDWNDQNGPAKDIVSAITSIEVIETIAVARVESDNWTGHRFSDLFTLLKLDGHWKIMNKVFHLHA